MAENKKQGFVRSRGAEYRFRNSSILSAEVFFLERRHEWLTGARIWMAALLMTALAIWLLWSRTVRKGMEAPSESAVLVCAEGEESVYG